MGHVRRTWNDGIRSSGGDRRTAGRKDATVVAVVGDGGFQMTLQELDVIRELNLPVKVVILNNACLGMVRQWQEIF